MKEEVRKLISEQLFGGFYRCPTTGRILEALPYDDKVLCNCGRSNPKIPQERTPETGTHIVRFLEKVTTEEYIRSHGDKS